MEYFFEQSMFCMWGGYHTEAGLIVPQMCQQGMKTALVSGVTLATDEY
jgi:branched-chain amino acid transport system substrate-binding protein